MSVALRPGSSMEGTVRTGMSSKCAAVKESGAMMQVSWPESRRWRATRTTELETPFTRGRNDSATMAMRMSSLKRPLVAAAQRAHREVANSR